MAKKPYVKLPGRGQRGTIIAASICSLWMAEDHLMLVEGLHVSEDYKRFYFKDIKAIVMRRTKSWITNTWIFLGMAILVMGIFTGIAFAAEPVSRAVFLWIGACFAGIFLLCLIINFLRGPTCVCHLRTPVQQEELPSLKRVRTARKALARIRLAVEAVQGSFGRNDLEQTARLIEQYGFEAGKTDVPAAKPAMPPPLPGQARFYGSRWQIGLIAALIATAVLEILSVMGIQGSVLTSLNMLVNLLVGGISVGVWVRNPRGAPKAAAWARLGVWGSWFAVGWVYGFFAGIKYSIEHPGQQVDMIKLMGTMPHSYFICMSVAAATYIIWAALESLALIRARKLRAARFPATSNSAALSR